MMVQGFSHVTINVRDLSKSLTFYRDMLGMKVRHLVNTDAYLEWGTAWICIIERSDYEQVTHKHIGTDHIAFYISEKHFNEAVEILEKHNVKIVRGPIKRGVGWSVNFLDPDGTELELHTSTLEKRMTVWK
ncbi:VOC family protein [Paenibacillus alkalitolerans]|uniref:VOC family protein n=1 Tax=Paenibacillus alkalitolerans TaxID=2799335 RepID=UPI0018F66CD4|nr:VOC family protein [Paenibacillus alkalitolerans]